jgi:SAM-dependent methyltransferase
MTRFFASKEAAHRYHTYRPKVHHVVLEWLGKHCPSKRWRRGLDVACGTGDSTVPLLKVCEYVLGIDASEEMLVFAREQRLNTQRATYDGVDSPEGFDLISTCMAFHWFDPAKALRAYKSLSCAESTWLIYNFGFAGHHANSDFNLWFRTRYLKLFPTPPRNPMASVIPRDDPEINLIAENRGTIPVNFTPENLAGYLCTQSNVESAVLNGADYEQIHKDLLAEISAIAPQGPYEYTFSYEIHRYARMVPAAERPNSD